jgi:hypothetical protein
MGSHVVTRSGALYASRRDADRRSPRAMHDVDLRDATVAGRGSVALRPYPGDTLRRSRERSPRFRSAQHFHHLAFKELADALAAEAGMVESSGAAADGPADTGSSASGSRPRPQRVHSHQLNRLHRTGSDSLTTTAFRTTAVANAVLLSFAARAQTRPLQPVEVTSSPERTYAPADASSATRTSTQLKQCGGVSRPTASVAARLFSSLELLADGRPADFGKHKRGNHDPRSVPRNGSGWRNVFRVLGSSADQ